MGSKEKFIGVLLACPAINNRKHRDTIVNQLPSEIKTNIARDDADKFDVTNIIDTCLNYSEGISKFISILASFEGNSIPMKEVYLCLFSWLEFDTNIIPPDKLEKLLVIVSGVDVPSDVLVEIYNANLYDFPINNKVNTLWDAIKYLLQIPRQGNIFPLLIFVEQLARYCETRQEADNDSAAELRKWIKQVSTDPTIKITSKEIKQMCSDLNREKEPGQSCSTYLLVELIPDEYSEKKDKEQFFVEISFWNYQNTQYDMTPWHIEDRPYIFEEIPKILSNVLVEHHEVPETIEFLLPKKLVSREFDQWTLDAGVEIPVKYGETYQVIVRMRDRLKKELNPVIHKRWQIKWAQFQQFSQTDKEEVIFWIDEQDKYTTKQLLLCLESPKNTTSVVMAFDPVNTPTNKDILPCLLQTGIPVALWLRQNCQQSQDVKEHIQAIVSCQNLRCLPEIIYQKRQEAIDEMEVGNHLTLLWDDPERIPPKYDYVKTRLQIP